METLLQSIRDPIFFWGALGAVAPEIVILYRMRNRKYRVKNPAYYIGITALFVIIGGFLAIGLQAANSIAAIYMGASWPANLGLYFGKPPNPDGKHGRVLSFREMLGMLIIWRTGETTGSP